MQGSEPSLDQLMSDLRRIAREAPAASADYEPPQEPGASPPVRSLHLADHGIGIQGLTEARQNAGAVVSSPSAAKPTLSGKTMALLGGVLLLVLVGGTVVMVRKSGRKQQGGTGGTGGTQRETSAGKRRGEYGAGRRGARARQGVEEDEEGEAGREDDQEGDESGRDADGRHVRFSREVQVREFERDQAPQVSVKISSDDIL